MKKVLIGTLSIYLTASLSSCFLFKKKEHCPAYGVNQKHEQKQGVKKIIFKEEVKNTTENAI